MKKKNKKFSGTQSDPEQLPANVVDVDRIVFLYEKTNLKIKKKKKKDYSKTGKLHQLLVYLGCCISAFHTNCLLNQGIKVAVVTVHLFLTLSQLLNVPCMSFVVLLS